MTPERSLGTSERRIALGLASRMARGALADLAWRRQQGRVVRRLSSKEEAVERFTLARSVVRVGAGVLALLAVPLVGTALSDEVDWTLADFVVAGVLLAIIGTSFELAARRSGTVLLGGAIVGLGVAAAALGEIDDAPGAVLLGALLASGGAAVVYRRLRPAG